MHLFHNPFSKTFLASALVLLCYINHLATPAKLQEIGIIVRPSPQSRNKNAFKSVEKPFWGRLFLAAAEEFERGLGGGEAEVAGEEGVVDESELFGYFLDGIEAGEKEALGI